MLSQMNVTNPDQPTGAAEHDGRPRVECSAVVRARQVVLW